MKKVLLITMSDFKGKYFSPGKYFEEYLWEFMLERFPTEIAEEKWFSKLQFYISNKTSHPIDTLNDIFQEKITLDWKFAKNIKLWDIISPKCLKSIDDIGEALIELLIEANILLIFSRRLYINEKKIQIVFEPCDYEEHIDCFKELQNNRSSTK